MRVPKSVVDLIVSFIDASCATCRAPIHLLRVRHVRVWWWNTIGRIVEYQCSNRCAYHGTSIKQW